MEKVACEPDRLKLLLDYDNAGCPELTIRSLDGKPFSITAIKSTADCITAKFNPDVKATEFILEPKVYIEKLKNPKGRLSICLDHPDGNVVYVLFDVLPEFTVNPPLLVVLNAEPEKPLVRKISVLSNYGRDFEIESLSSKSSFIGVKVLGQTKLNNGYQLDLEIKPPAAKGKTKFTDEFSIDFKSGEKLTLRCNGFYRK